VTAAGRGHDVTLIEAASEVGGQFNIARKIPGKEEFGETLRYFRKQLDLTRVKVRLNTRAEAEALADEGFDEIVLATGVTPRTPEIDGVDHAKTLSYLDVLRDEIPVGKTVAVIGAGGIGHDVSEYLVERHAPPSINRFFRTWGVDPDYRTAGGRTAPQVEPAE